MEVANGEVLLVGCLWVVAMRDVDNVVLNVFLDNKPRTSAQPHALSLSVGVEPVPFVVSDEFASLQLYDVALLLSQIAAQVVVIIDFAQKADALRVATMGWRQMFALSNLTYLLLHHVTNGKQCLLQLPVVYLRQKVRLILDRVWTGAEPLQFTIY